MSLSALESVEDALGATRRLLLPFDRGTWFRLAAVMLFVGGVGGFGPTSVLNFASVPDSQPSQPPADGGVQPAPGGPDPGALTPELTPALVVFLILLALFAIALYVLWNVAGAVMEFVFVASLGAEDVRLREFFRSNLWPGVRLFAFRTGATLLTFGGLGLALLVLGVLVGGLPVSQWSDAALLAVLLVGVPLFIGAIIVLGLVLGFTTTFVVPVMLAEDRGVFSAWRRFLGVLVDEWTEYLVYLFVNWILGIAIGFATGVLTFGAAVVLGVPALLVTLLVLFVVGANAIGGTIVLVVWVLAGVLFFVATLVIAVPFRTYRRYYGLFVLGDTDADLDVVPATRVAVRTDGGDDSPPDGDGGDDSPSDGDGSDESTGEADGTADDGGGRGGGDGWNVDR